MCTNQDFEDSLIDWTSPVIEQLHLSQPLIPLPIYTSPLSDVDGDNPFDALERQINDDVLDLLNVNSLLTSGRNASICEKFDGNKCDTSEILIQLSAEDVGEPTTELDRPDNVVNLPGIQTCPFSCISTTMGSVGVRKKADVDDVVNGCVSTSLNMSRGLMDPYSALHGFSDMSTPSPLILDKKKQLDQSFSPSNHSDLLSIPKRERSRSTESLWSILDVDEDIRFITMPVWCDELLSSSDEESNSRRLSKSLPIECDEPSSSEKTSSQILKVTRNNRPSPSLLTRVQTNFNAGKEQPALKSTLLNVVFPSKIRRDQEKPHIPDKLKALKREKSKPTMLLKKENSPLATSTPHSRRDTLERKSFGAIPRSNGPRRTLIKKENISRLPSPDSTSSMRLNHRNKIIPKDKITKTDRVRRNSLSNSKVSSSQQSPTANRFFKKLR